MPSVEFCIFAATEEPVFMSEAVANAGAKRRVVPSDECRSEGDRKYYLIRSALIAFRIASMHTPTSAKIASHILA